MASAVLASTNEPHWGRRKGGKCSAANISSVRNRSEFFNPNPNHSNVHCEPISNPNPRTSEPPPPPPSSDYLTIDLAECSTAELKALKRRLKAELDTVRRLRSRLETFHAVPPRASPAEALSPRGTKKGTPGKKRGPDPAVNGAIKRMMKSCGSILGRIMRHKLAWVFNAPVDVDNLGLHDYYKIIEHPMDLGTVKARLDKGEYKSPFEFASDVRLTFRNAMEYNPKGDDVHAMADKLLVMFEKSFRPIYEKFESESGTKKKRSLPDNILTLEEKSKETLPNQSNTEVATVKSTPARSDLDHVVVEKSMPKLPKPLKGKGHRSKRPMMTFEEKTTLGECLQELPYDKMGAMLAIVSRSNTGMKSDGDEIELDFEALDDETLWELDRFVRNIKKAKNTMNMQEIVPAQTEKSPVRELTPKADVADDDDVDIGDEIPSMDYPPVEIDKDSNCISGGTSSSSGSGSSSSSSGSGSASSPGSDSDEDSVQAPFVVPEGGLVMA